MCYSGCFYHPGCCIPDDKIPNAAYKRHKWETKKQILKRYGNLHVMRDCVWRKQRDQTAINIPQTQMANILLKDTEGKDKIHFQFISGELSVFFI